MIAVRALNLLAGDRWRATSVGLGLRYADRIVAISEFSLDDSAAYYPTVASHIRDVGVGVRIGLTAGIEDFVAPDAQERKALARIESEPFVLVVGNHYPHKQVVAAVEAIQDVGVRIVAFGPVTGLEHHKHVEVLPSGFLSDAGVSDLYRHAALVVFPSSFEGFGLPLVEALNAGTPVVIWDSAISREITNANELHDAVRFFSQFDELSQVVTEAMADRKLKSAASRLHGHMPDMTEFCVELWRNTTAVLDEPVDVSALAARWDALKLAEQVARA